MPTNFLVIADMAVTAETICVRLNMEKLTLGGEINQNVTSVSIDTTV